MTRQRHIQKQVQLVPMGARLWMQGPKMKGVYRSIAVDWWAPFAIGSGNADTIRALQGCNPNAGKCVPAPKTAVAASSRFPRRKSPAEQTNAVAGL